MNSRLLSNRNGTPIFAQYLLPISILTGCTSQKVSDTGTDTSDKFTPAWTVIESTDANGAWLRAHVPSDETESVWLVGGQPTQGAIKVGNAVEGFTSLSLPADTPLLNWADGTAEDMWVGGLYGTILHWNGNTWEDHSLDIEEAIWGLVVEGQTIVAVGGSSRWGGESAVAVTKDSPDTEWTTLAIPEELGNLSNLFKVDFDGSNYWMVGTGGAAIYGQLDSLEALPTGITQDLITVLGLPDGKVSIVGGRGTGVYMTGNDGELSEATQLIAGINGVAANQSGNQLLVGELGFATFGQVGQDNGTAWTDIPASTTHILHAATTHELNGSEFWYAVGGNLATADSTFEGSILAMEVPQ